VNRGTMGVNSLPKTVTRQRCDCDLNPGPSAPESSTLTTRLSSSSRRTWPIITTIHVFLEQTTQKISHKTKFILALADTGAAN